MITWFCVCSYKLREVKSCSKTFWIVHNQKWVWPLWSHESNFFFDFFACLYKFRKAKSWFHNVLVGEVNFSVAFYDVKLLNEFNYLKNELMNLR